MDSQVVYFALISSNVANSPFGMLIEDCHELANSMENVSFSLVRRSTNSVAHCLARALGSMADSCIWMTSAPGFLVPCLLTDCYY